MYDICKSDLALVYLGNASTIGRLEIFEMHAAVGPILSRHGCWRRGCSERQCWIELGGIDGRPILAFIVPKDRCRQKVSRLQSAVGVQLIRLAGLAVLT